MLLFRQLFTCLRFLLTMSLNREWVSIRWNSTKTRQKIESINSEKEKSSSLWRIFENSLKSTWKKVSKIKLFMLINIKSLRQIIKQKIKYDFLLEIFKSIAHSESSIIKCSNHLRFWKKRQFVQARIINRNEYSFSVSYLTVKKRFRELIVETNHRFIIIRRDWRRREIRRERHHWLTIDKKID
jgi:hypothetical protein